MASQKQQLEAGIDSLEAQRALLGDAVVDACVAGMRAQLKALSTPAPSFEPAQALRQVSVLFLDVVGSTTLAQHLDPETISAVMDGALARGTAIVQAHRGKVLQYAGDNILAAFGANESREDDAERAVHCGLALLELGKRLGAEVEEEHGHTGFDVRVGVHTGGVLLGGGVDDGSIRGIAVNIAARMEQTAPAGALRISQDTYAQVRGLFEVDGQEPLTVKGVDTPIQSYLVKRAQPRNFRIGTRGIEGVVTKMIGRDAELEQLQGAFKRLFETRQLVAITVVADAGIGKSRLLNEFEAWTSAWPESFSVFRGRATPQTDSQTFGLLRDIVAWRFQIQDDDSIEVARKKVEDGIVPLFLHDEGLDQAQAHAHLLGHLIGIEWRDSRHLKGILDDPKQIRNRAFHAAAQLFRRTFDGDGGPVVLELEDLHWADGESLDFLNYLAEVDRDVPLLVLSFARPTLFERRADWSSTTGVHQRIDLTPLDKRASRDLANELLKKLPDVPAALRELVTGNAEGNPFYMEELVKMLVDQGAIQTRTGSGEAWSVDPGRLLEAHVPSTLTGVVQARLDGLPSIEKRALQRASVVGAVFWDQALAAIAEESAEQLPALVRRELTLPTADSALDGLREYAFRHHVLHQVTYGTVLKHHKREGHAKVARWLAALTEQGNARAGDFLGAAAEHFELAGDGSNAAEFHARAAEQAGQRMAHDRVLMHAGRALVLLGDRQDSHAAQAELRWRLLSAREKTLALQASREEQAADIKALEQLADLLDDDCRRAEVARRRSLRAIRLADWSVAEIAARRCMALATRKGDDSRRLNALRLLAWVQVLHGDIDAGRALGRESLAEARSLGLRSEQANLLNVLGIGAELQGDVVAALDLYGQASHLFRETGDRVLEAVNLNNLGRSWMRLGNLTQAHSDMHAAVRMLRDNDDRGTEGLALSSLSMLALWQGNEPKALALARQALDITLKTQARDFEVLALQRLGAAELALGRSAAAREAYTKAHELAVRIGVPWQHDASAGLARVALTEEGADAAQVAMSAIKPVLDHIAVGGKLDGTTARLIELTCFEVLTRVGDPRAADWLARAYSALMTQADEISRSGLDAAMRQGFLQNIPHHRAIMAAWAKQSVAGELTACVPIDRYPEA